MNIIKYIQFLIHIFKVLHHNIFTSFFCLNPMIPWFIIYNPAKHHGWSCSEILFQAFVNTIPSPSKSWFYAFTCQNPTHPIMSYFMMFLLSDWSPDFNFLFLAMLQHRNMCPYHILSGNMIVTTQVMRPHLHIYHENSSVGSQLRLPEFLFEQKPHKPCRKDYADNREFNSLFSVNPEATISVLYL